MSIQRIEGAAAGYLTPLMEIQSVDHLADKDHYLVFMRDAEGKQVTVELHHTAARTLAQMLEQVLPKA